MVSIQTFLFKKEPSPPRELVSSTLPAKLLWQVHLEEQTNSYPIILENIVVIPTEHFLQGFDKFTGKLLWKHEYESYQKFPMPIDFDERRIIYSSRDEAVIAVDTTTGDIVWQRYTSGRNSLASIYINDILIVGETVYTVLQPTRAEAIDINTGDLIWSIKHGINNNMGSRGARLLFVDNSLYVRTNKVHIFSPDTGNLKRVIDKNLLPNLQVMNNEIYGTNFVLDAYTLDETGKLVSSTYETFYGDCHSFNLPYTFKENVFYGVGECGGVFKVDTKTKETLWNYREDLAAVSPITVYQDSLYVLFDNGEIHAIEPDTAQPIGIATIKHDIDDGIVKPRGIISDNAILVVSFGERDIWAFCKPPCQ